MHETVARVADVTIFSLPSAPSQLLTKFAVSSWLSTDAAGAAQIIYFHAKRLNRLLRLGDRSIEQVVHPIGSKAAGTNDSPTNRIPPGDSKFFLHTDYFDPKK